MGMTDKEASESCQNLSCCTHSSQGQGTGTRPTGCCTRSWSKASRWCFRRLFATFPQDGSFHVMRSLAITSANSAVFAAYCSFAEIHALLCADWMQLPPVFLSFPHPLAWKTDWGLHKTKSEALSGLRSCGASPPGRRPERRFRCAAQR